MRYAGFLTVLRGLDVPSLVKKPTKGVCVYDRPCDVQCLAVIEFQPDCTPISSPEPPLRYSNTCHPIQSPLQGEESRTNQLLRSTSPPSLGEDRSGAMVCLAHHLIWQCRCTVYGGFVRDWVIRGERANDLDALLPRVPGLSERGRDSVVRSLVECAHGIGLEFCGSRHQPNSYRVSFYTSRGGYINVELVDPHLRTPPPHVDSSAGNVAVSTAGMHRKVEGRGDLVPLATCLEHIRAKQFVCYLDFKHRDNRGALHSRVVRKYLDRGWTLLNELPRDQMEELYSSPDYTTWEERGQVGSFLTRYNTVN
ncbi:hypothetical protein KIPB_003670 [Kipferlia bialata]|uniref:Uncharacterized protein n=1 Tax=Kipferlia bialata TaxID=797122 RepID=A0A391P1I6_9EUKA|nr:hypothetical protein KIPB_003501 [Kipferlia bialata]GCA62462.1 hypothetical protein KIPB_003670 [Kipferlia bialata]|eukprot:g3501.t1